jgi:hypothetical protein
MLLLRNSRSNFQRERKGRISLLFKQLLDLLQQLF